MLAHRPQFDLHALFSSSWTVVSEQMEEQLQASGCVLQVWEVYSQLATSWSQRLQTLQTDADAPLLPDERSPEQLAARIHQVQVT